jgi:hypothetical protein
MKYIITKFDLTNNLNGDYNYFGLKGGVRSPVYFDMMSYTATKIWGEDDDEDGGWGYDGWG